MPSALKPGYVYVLAHPVLSGQFKVGRTYRPPHTRAQELSRTAWPTPLEVVHARFFWDAVAAERQAHVLLEPHGRQKEFFAAPLTHIRQVIQTLPMSTGLRQHRTRGAEIAPWDSAWHDRVADPEDWSADRDRLEEEWGQVERDLIAPDERVRASGWRRAMRLSAEGWAEGSRRLAEQLVRHCPGPAGAHRASWVLDAAAAQGLAGAALRACWLRSWGEEGDLDSWRAGLADVWLRLQGRSWEEWPELVRDTLSLERTLVARLEGATQARRIQAATAFGGWDQVPAMEVAP